MTTDRLPSETSFQTGCVLSEVALERLKQDKKWGEQNHHPQVYLSILVEEVGEVAKEANDAQWKGDTFEHIQCMRTELIQVAAVAVAMVECLDRNSNYTLARYE